jgi:hypothetical protein
MKTKEVHKKRNFTHDSETYSLYLSVFIYDKKNSKPTRYRF